MLVLVAATACGGRPLFDRPAPAPVVFAPLPVPAGDYAVGSRLLDVDDPRPAGQLPEGLPRVVEAQVWYPAARDAAGPRMPYLPRAAVIERLGAERWYAERPAELASLAASSTTAFRDALPAPRTGGFPLVLFAPNAASPVQDYSALLQELASRGMIVIAVEPRVARPGAIRRTSLPVAADESLAAADLLLVLRQFVAASGGVAAIAQRADLTRTGVLAHGSGGDAMLELCARETVVRRCAAIDSQPDGASAPPLRPLLVLRSGTAHDDHAAETSARARWLTLFSRAEAPTRLLRLEGSGYLSATDAPWLRPDRAADSGAGADPQRVLTVTAALLSAHFAADGEAFVAIDSAIAGYPELLLES